jgi:DNA polymerase-3 subunit alpha
MMAASQAAHQASDRGQLSMFGAAPSPAGGGGLGWGSADTFGTLPDEAEIPNHDKLTDEKELTGAYFSDNPLMRLARSSGNRATHLATQLDESLARQTITLAGVVTGARIITTKKGDPMAFVSLEDPSGATEITVFPKVFERTRELWRADSLLLVKGKVELRDGKIQVLCDSAEEYQIPTDDGRPPTATLPTSAVGGQSSPVQVAMPNAEEAAIAEVDPFAEDGAFLPPLPEEPLGKVGRIQNSESSSQKTNGNGHANKSNGGNGSASIAKPNGGNSGMYPPIPEPARVAESAARYQAARHLRIFLTRTNDYDEDLRRMRELLALLSNADGRDRFTFYVPNPQGVVQLDFPNHSTSYSQVQATLDELLAEWGTLEVQ